MGTKHNLKSAEIRALYELLCRYESKYYNQRDSTDTFSLSLMTFINDNEIYLGRLNRNEIIKQNNSNSFFLYKQSNDANRLYWLIRHIRDCFAHGGIVRNKKNKQVHFKERKKTLRGTLSDDLFKLLLNSLPKH